MSPLISYCLNECSVFKWRAGLHNLQKPLRAIGKAGTQVGLKDGHNSDNTRFPQRVAHEILGLRWRLRRFFFLLFSFFFQILLRFVSNLFFKVRIARDSSRYLYTHDHISIIHKSQEWPKCSSTEEWKNKTWMIPTMEHYSVLKRKKILTPTTNGLKYG